MEMAGKYVSEPTGGGAGRGGAGSAANLRPFGTGAAVGTDFPLIPEVTPAQRDSPGLWAFPRRGPPTRRTKTSRLVGRED